MVNLADFMKKRLNKDPPRNVFTPGEVKFLSTIHIKNPRAYYRGDWKRLSDAIKRIGHCETCNEGQIDSKDLIAYYKVRPEDWPKVDPWEEHLCFGLQVTRPWDIESNIAVACIICYDDRSRRSAIETATATRLSPGGSR